MIDAASIPERIYGKLVNALLTDLTVKSATYYVSEKLVVRLRAPIYHARKGKRDGRSKRENFSLSVGSPNYAERQFIKTCVKTGEKFPVKKIQLKRIKVK